MRRTAKVCSLLLMLVLVSSLAPAFEKPAAVQGAPANQIVIGSQDVITASDAGGGYLSNRDILIIVLIVLAVIGLAAILG
jgi:hypothetical protein